MQEKLHKYTMPINEMGSLKEHLGRNRTYRCNNTAFVKKYIYDREGKRGVKGSFHMRGREVSREGKKRRSM